ncbi:PH domain-containing protein [Parabacteroides sp. AF17-28]|jgi:hypothetical protein|uniref:PH domain-containing protein n=1 Tax=Parabacteroides sp. AF17-28 TaxID=2292241 RepID=UPI000F009107|nr:PH domain-containing protein [Parabacteroides sp. AF17-28]RHR62287.1 hypothetical protein DWW90_02450 [Parabacteroides sp. AF17-28]
MEARISSSTMDSTNKIKTSVTLFILYGVCLFPAYYGELYALLGMFAFSTLLSVTTRGFMPKRFIVDGEKLTIDTPFRKYYIRIEEIISAREVDQTDLGVGIRSFGSSWLFGYLGYFSFTTIGHVKIFARRSNNCILITTAGRGNFIIAPDDPEFINYLNRAILWR